MMTDQGSNPKERLGFDQENCQIHLQRPQYLEGPWKFQMVIVQAGGVDALRGDAEKLQNAVDFATACGAFTTTKPGGIDAQPSQEQADNLLKKAPHAEAAV